MVIAAAVCVPCWRVLNPDRRIAETNVGIAQDASCSRCGTETRSGLTRYS